MVDLTKNPLADDSTNKDPWSNTNTTDSWIFYLTILKFFVIGVLILLSAGGVYVFITGAPVAVEVVVVKEVTSEKLKEVKNKLQSNGSNGPVISEKLVKTATGLWQQANTLVENTLIKQGLHPDAPAYCLAEDPLSSFCLNFTDNEVKTSEYQWVRTTWPDTCPESFIHFRTLLKANNLITQNQYRILSTECRASSEREIERNKQKTKDEIINNLN